MKKDWLDYRWYSVLYVFSLWLIVVQILMILVWHPSKPTVAFFIPSIFSVIIYLPYVISGLIEITKDVFTEEKK